MTGPEPGGARAGAPRTASGPVQQQVELVGPHLRVAGLIGLGRFTSLADLVNHNRSFLVLRDARLLDRVGAAMEPVLPELAVNQDDVTFIARHEGPGETDDASSIRSVRNGSDRAGAERPRQFVILTPGHAITGGMHVFRDMTLANFVEATDPRFIAVTDAVARSLADDRTVARAAHLLVNRTQISAIAELDAASGAIGAADAEPRGQSHSRAER